MKFVPQNCPERPTDSARVPVYLQSWFTKVIADITRIHKVSVVEGHEVIGTFTVSHYRNAVGLKYNYNLPWARIGGPLIAEHVRPTRRAEIVRKLLAQLPANASYFFTLSNKQDFETFLEAGFKSDLEDNFKVPFDQASTWESRFSKMTKRHLRKAREELIVSTLSPDGFIRLFDAHLSMRRRKPYTDLSIARHILVEATRRNQGSIITACRRDTGEIDAAVACLWDGDSYYYWMTTRRPPVDGQAKPHQGAVKLLLYKAITDAHAKGLTFDFDGVPSGFGNKSSKVRRLYAGMGAEKSVRYRLKRETRVERLASLVRTPIKLAITSTIGRIMTLKSNY
jgi:hypothetical protein